MGSIHFFEGELIDTLVEIVGFKCGISVCKSDVAEALSRRGMSDDVSKLDLPHVRLHSSSFEEMVFALLKHYGYLEEDFNKFTSVMIYHSVKRDARKLEMYNAIMKLYVEMMPSLLDKSIELGYSSVKIDPIVDIVAYSYGREGLQLLINLIKGNNNELNASPWSGLRKTEWRNQIELKALFKSEKLNSSYGNFFDQRYIDFLQANFEKIDEIHWRKFEELTAEYLDRAGYHVALGPGRGDDGVDVRAWMDGQSDHPHIVVQCKRQREKVPKVVIKALYADVIHEQADSGLIVTTSYISPGAEDSRIARAYPIDIADRDALRKWLASMRTPGAGLKI